MNESPLRPQERFTDRVDNYVKYRPAYPLKLIEFIQEEFSITPSSTVVDMGSGTGIFTKQLLELACCIVAVEPNQAMREVAEKELGSNKNFRSQNASAEKTDLPDGVADLITAAQAFHWFRVDEVKKEWNRLLKSQGKVCLVWNDRDDSNSAFLREYKLLLEKFGTDKEMVRKRYGVEAKRIAGDGNFDSFFGDKKYSEKTFSNSQLFDFEGLYGRLLSSSYAPQAGHPQFEPMIRSLRESFDRHQKSGTVEFIYTTKVYYG